MSGVVFLAGYSVHALDQGGVATLVAAVALLTFPLACLLPLRGRSGGVLAVFGILFALDLCERFGPGVLARPSGYSYFLFRLYDALAPGVRHAKRSAASVSGAQALVQATAFPVLPAGPILLRGAWRIVRTPFQMRRVFYPRAVVLLAIGIGKLYVLLPVAEALLETGLLRPLAFDLRTVRGVFSTGLYQYVRLYLDFSGYTDVVVACCAFCGWKIRHNFHRPYLAPTLRDFWRRWHITLGDFIRRYVYIPLGGRADSRLMQARNLFASLLLIGLWHGLTPHFAIWGALHGVFLALELCVLEPLYRGASVYAPRLTLCVQWLVTQAFVTATWVVFFWR